MKSPPPPRLEQTGTDYDQVEQIERAYQKMRQTLHAMGLYLDCLQANAASAQSPILHYLQESVLSLGQLLNDLCQTSSQVDSRPTGLKGMQCLVISDDLGAVQTTVSLLQSWGCQATGAASVAEAPALLSGVSEYEWVLCELHQTGQEQLMSILEQVHRLQPKALPVVIQRVSPPSETAAESPPLPGPQS